MVDMRFNDPTHLENWQKTHIYPAIHHPLANLVHNYLNHLRVLDLGCGFGLLGQNIMDRMANVQVYGVDCDAQVLAAGKAAGINCTLMQRNIQPKTSYQIADLCRTLNIRAVMARRVFPEIFGHDPPGLTIFAHQLREAGVAQIFVQGRIVGHRSVNPLKSLDDELAHIRPHFEEVVRTGDIAFLQAPL